MTESSRKKHFLILFGLLVALGGAVMIGVSIGAVRIPLTTVGNVFLNRMTAVEVSGPSSILSTQETIIMDVRLPRVILTAIVGAALATAGAVFQGLFKNPMADPYVIGVSSGAALGATVAVMLNVGAVSLGLYAVPFMAFLGALAATFIVYRLAKVGGRIPISTLLLSGLAISSLLSAVMTFIMAGVGKDLHSVIFWLMGGLSARNWSHVNIALPFFVIGFPIAMIFARDLNIMLLGDEKALHLGIEVEQVKKILLVSGAMMAAAAVSVSGLIGFVGLMTPHAVRLLVGPNHKLLLPASALGGAIFLIFADILARVLLAPTEIPVGVITALLGAPFFIYLLRIKRKVLV